MIFVDIEASKAMSPRESGAHVALLQNSGLHTPRGKFAFNLCPAKFWTLQSAPAKFWSPESVPRGVLEQCNMCRAFSWRHSYRGLNVKKNHLKLEVRYFFLLFFVVNHCHFKYLYN